MMPQNNTGQPMYERSHYEEYEGNQGYSQRQRHEIPYGQSSQGDPYDDNFVEALAQRITQMMKQGTTGTAKKASSNQRLGLAIVSTVMLVPLAGIMLGILGWLGLIPFALACFAIIIINAIFHG